MANELDLLQRVILICKELGIYRHPAALAVAVRRRRGVELIADKAASATCLTDLATRSTSGFCRPATSRSLPHCLRARSCRCWLIGDCLLVLNAASTGCCTPMARPIAEEGQGCPRSSYPCCGYGLMALTRSGPSPVKGSLY